MGSQDARRDAPIWARSFCMASRALASASESMQSELRPFFFCTGEFSTGAFQPAWTNNIIYSSMQDQYKVLNMKLKNLFIMFVLFVIIWYFLTACTRVPARIDGFRIGGKIIHIPNPAGLIEMGTARTGLAPCVILDNRLVAAYITPDDFKKLGSSPLTMETYAMVQVSKFWENKEYTEEQFKADEKQMSANLTKGDIRDLEKTLNDQAGKVGVSAITLGMPVNMGCSFSQKDAFSWVVVLPVSSNENIVTMAVSCSMVRIHGSVLFLYVYSRFDGKATVSNLTAIAHKWADDLIKANLKRKIK